MAINDSTRTPSAEHQPIPARRLATSYRRERLIRDGLARDCPRYSGERYAAAEDGSTIWAKYRLPGNAG